MGTVDAGARWEQRHRRIAALVAAHAPVLVVLALMNGASSPHAGFEAVPLLALAALAVFAPLGPRPRSILASLGLMSAAAGLVHVTGGATEAHFHYFVLLGVLALYDDLWTYATAIAFVLVEHAVGGTILPRLVFEEGSRHDAPVTWALVHGLFVLFAAATNVVATRIRDRERDEVDRALRAAAEAVAASEARLGALVENGTDLITVCDEEFVLRYASPAHHKVLGVAPESRLGQPIERYVHAEDLPGLERVVRRVLARPGTPVTTELRLLHADGTWRWVESTMVNRLADPAVEGIVATTRDVTDRVEAAAELAHRANHDVLTGLPNRRFLETHALPGTGMLALLFVDLDHFKRVNDELGHDGGDRVLVRTADALRESVRPGDLVVRIGGDEFVVLARVEDEAAATHLADRVCDAVRQPIDLDGRLVVIGASVGVATTTVGFDDDLLRLADDAMYRAKALGRGRVVNAAEDGDDPVVPRRAEDAAVAQARYEQIVATSKDALAVNVGGRVVAVSPGALELLGITDPATVLGRDVLEFVAPEATEQAEARRSRIEAGPWPGEEAIALQRADGGRVLVDLESTPVLWRSEVATQIRLRPRSDWWDVILRAAGGVSAGVGQAVVVTDLDLRIVSWNDAATELYGWGAEEVLGRHVVDVIPWVGDVSDLTGAAQALRVDGAWRGRASQRRRDGTVVEVDAHTHLLHDHDGRPVGVVSVNAPRVLDVREEIAPVLAAIEAGEVVVHYQPVVHARDGRCAEVEALVRWAHPERGLLPPSAFVPALEAHHAVAPLTDLVLRTAAAQVVAWRAAGAPRLELSVNLSGSELADPTLPARVAAALEATGLPAEALWLEVTETAVTADTEAAAAALAALADLGCRIALDDFGTGFATLALLHSFVVHALKVDRMFVAAITEGTNDLAIVRSVRALAHELGAVVVAEGVETEAQEALLQVLGCDLLQGHLYGAPVPAEGFDPAGFGPRRDRQASTGR